MTRKQWSGNDKKSVIRGIGVLSCVYVNPETEQFWVIDYRIFDPERDGLSKLDHVRGTCCAWSRIEGCLARRCSWTPGTQRRN